jgi:hypothetical protein
LICADEVIRYFSRAEGASRDDRQEQGAHAARIMMLRFKILPLQDEGRDLDRRATGRWLQIFPLRMIVQVRSTIN